MGTSGVGSGVISIVNNNKQQDITVFPEDKIIYTEGSFLEGFTFPLIAGTPSLRQPHTLAISESLAKKYFGHANPVGKTVSVSNQFGKTSYTVTAVFKDL